MHTLFTSEASLRPPESKPDGFSGLKTTNMSSNFGLVRNPVGTGPAEQGLQMQPAPFQNSTVVHINTPQTWSGALALFLPTIPKNIASL